MTRRYIAFLLLICFMIPVLGCGIDKPSEQDTSQTETKQDGATDSQGASTNGGSDPSEDEPEAAPVYLVQNGTAQFELVCENKNYWSSALSLQKNLQQKTGVEFGLYRFERTDNTLGKLFIGSDYNAVSNGTTALAAEGYCAVVIGKNIHLCGYSDEKIMKCVQKFSSGIPNDCVVKDQNGKASVLLPEAALFFSQPDYPYINATLLDTHISNYTVVLSENAPRSEKVVANAFIKEAKIQTGFELAQATHGASVSGKRITLGTTVSESSAQAITDPMYYCMESSENGIYIGYGSLIALNEAFKQIHTLYKQSSNAPISVTKTLKDSYGVRKQDSGDIRIMTSNVLFYGSSTALTDPRDRVALLTDCYLLFKPDFIGMQEADDGMLPLLSAALTDEYAMVSVNWQAQGNRYDIPIFYRKDLYRVEESGYKYMGGCYGYTWGRFTKISTGEEIIVMNLHYHYKSPADRLPQCQLVNDELKRLTAAYPNVPIAVTGDYNSGIDYEEHKVMMNGLAMKSGVLLATDLGPDQFGYAVDHVMVTTELVTVKRHRCVTYEAYRESSDHIAIFIDLVIK